MNNQLDNLQTDRSFGKFMVICLGQFVSLLGSGLSTFAFGIWVFTVTGKATYFALTVTMYFLPGIFLGPIAGSLADRKNRKKIIIVTDSLDAVIKIIMAALFFSGKMSVWMVYPFIFISETLTVFQGPAFSASIPMLVAKEKLSRAHGLVQLSSSTEDMVVPAVGGILYATIGLEGILVIDFCSYFVAIITILFVKIPQPPVIKKIASSYWKGILTDFKTVWQYLQTKRELLSLIFIIAGFNLIASSMMALFNPLLLTMFDTKIYGVVNGIKGSAMVLSSFLITILPDNNHKIRTLFILYMVSGIGIMILAGFQIWPLVALGVFIFIFSIPYGRVMIMSVIQTKAEKSILGRLGGFMMVVLRIPVILTSLLAAPIVDFIFEPLMQTNGLLGSGLIGSILGSGKGRGIALFLFILGVVLFSYFLYMFIFNKPLLTMEKRLPDAV